MEVAIDTNGIKRESVKYEELRNYVNTISDPVLIEKIIDVVSNDNFDPIAHKIIWSRKEELIEEQKRLAEKKVLEKRINLALNKLDVYMNTDIPNCIVPRKARPEYILRDELLPVLEEYVQTYASNSNINIERLTEKVNKMYPIK